MMKINLRPATPNDLNLLRYWDQEAYLGQGYGTKIMQLAITRCFADAAVTGILVDPLASNRRAHRFYERLGFQFKEFRRFGQDDCWVYLLKRQDWDNSLLNPCE